MLPSGVSLPADRRLTTRAGTRQAGGGKPACSNGAVPIQALHPTAACPCLHVFPSNTCSRRHTTDRQGLSRPMLAPPHLRPLPPAPLPAPRRTGASHLNSRMPAGVKPSPRCCAALSTRCEKCYMPELPRETVVSGWRRIGVVSGQFNLNGERGQGGGWRQIPAKSSTVQTVVRWCGWQARHTRPQPSRLEAAPPPATAAQHVAAPGRRW